jgi:ABC-type phosphate transport system substrate-binding protein
MLPVKYIRILLILLLLSPESGNALAEVVAVVSAENPVTTLSKNQIVDIFLGKTDRLPDGRQIVPIDQAEGSTSRDRFYLNFAGKSPAQIKAYWSKIIFTGRGRPPPDVTNGVEIKQFILEHPDAIGYIERELVDDRLKVLHTQ